MLCDTIQALRKKAGLTQEQLAERVNVSRQAVSKWETGSAVPDLDKLHALCDAFGVTLDELTGRHTAAAVQKPEAEAKPAGKLGLVLCAAGALCMIAVGLVSLFAPSAADRMNASSVITVNGTGIALTLCAAVVCTGLVLHLRRR